MGVVVFKVPIILSKPSLFAAHVRPPIVTLEGTISGISYDRFRSSHVNVLLVKESSSDYDLKLNSLADSRVEESRLHLIWNKGFSIQFNVPSLSFTNANH